MRRQLLREEISYSAAQEKETNILHQLEYFEKHNQFITHLASKGQWIRSTVAHHVNVDPSRCITDSIDRWFWGSFNLCIPVTIRDWTTRKQPGDRVLLRLPLPYKVGEAFRPGNADEKVRCEAGTYAWLQENHPDIPIPRLYGFSLSSGESFTMIENMPFLARCYHRIRRQICLWIGRYVWSSIKASFSLVPSQYVRHPPKAATPPLGSGYILIERIEPEQGNMLSDTWFKSSNDATLRKTLFRGLARIMLSFTRTPLPRIGSFTIDNDGFISLPNRPLTLEIQQLENEEIPIDIPRDYTYSTTDSYTMDIIGLHNSRLLHQPNAVNNGSDFIQQATTLAGIRTAIPLFLRRDLRRGPFLFSLTDLHQSNIFVDKEWNITSLVDLERGCSLPIETIHPPYWLTSNFVDTIDEEEYKKLWTEFTDILAQEELDTLDSKREDQLRLSTVMARGWEMGTFWYSLALSSPTAIFRLFIDRIQTRLGKDMYGDEEYGLIIVCHWAFNVADILKRKIRDKEEYDIRLRQAFEVQN